MKKIEEKLEIAIKAAVSAGNILISHSNDVIQIKQSKKESLRDVVTEIDNLADKKIVEILKKYDQKLNILTEEQGLVKGGNKKGGNFWVIDPLDGTVNYIQQIPFYAVSIAYVENRNPKVGVVFLPFLNEIYYGAIDLGTYKNHSKIFIVDKKPTGALFAQAFSGKNYTSARERRKEFDVFQKVNDETMGCLRTGSAAVNLVYAAEGRFGGCFGKMNKIWDVMAGLIIAKLAGAKVQYGFAGKNKQLVNYVVSTPSSSSYLKKRVKEMF